MDVSLKGMAGAIGLVGRPPARVRNAVDRIPFVDKELFLLADFVPRGGTVVDVGASGGVHALRASQLVGPTGRVLAVEARAGSAGILRAWRNVLRRDNLTVVSTALGARPGSLEMRVPLVPTRSHAAGGDDGTLLARLPAARRTVGVTTLDLLATAQGVQRLDLLKVDVEGAELQVLEGGRATIEAHRPVVFIEVIDAFLQRSGRSAVELFDWFVSRGYRAHVFGDDGLVPADAATPSEYNYVFVPAAAA